MATSRSRGRSARHTVDCDLELRPLMNVFIVLIPMLLMSAVFMEIRVIEMSAPSAEGPAGEVVAKPDLHLSLRVHADAYELTGEGLAPVFVARGAVERKGTLSPTTTARLQQVLGSVATAHPGEHEIRIVAEQGTRYQEIVTLMDLARSAGLSDAALVSAREDA